MVIRGDITVDTVTLNFSVHGRRNEWVVTVGTKTDETVEASWISLFNELVAAERESVLRSRATTLGPMQVGR
jgi:hypothetical protein